MVETQTVAGIDGSDARLAFIDNDPGVFQAKLQLQVARVRLQAAEELVTRLEALVAQHEAAANQLWHIQLPVADDGGYW